MTTKNFIVPFERDSKTIYLKIYCRNFTSALFRDIFCLEILSCPPSWIFVDMHDTSQVWSRNFIFLRNNDYYAPITARTVSVSDSNAGWKGFKQYLIAGKHLGVALNGLSLLWRHQNIVNELKNLAKMAGSSFRLEYLPRWNRYKNAVIDFYLVFLNLF